MILCEVMILKADTSIMVKLSKFCTQHAKCYFHKTFAEIIKVQGLTTQLSTKEIQNPI